MTFWSCRKRDMIRKINIKINIKVNIKIYDVTNWLKNYCNNILPNISRNKGNQTMKFAQLIEYNKINIFLE